MTSKKIAIIGAGSFIGQRIITTNPHGLSFIPIVRKPIGLQGEIIVSNYNQIPKKVLMNVDAAINCVGLINAATKADYYSVNCDIPFGIAESVKRAGVSHFIHFSSLSVYGRIDHVGASSSENPISLYGKSKLAGDKKIKSLEDAQFAISFLRPPIVYDDDHGGKIAILVRFMARYRFFICPLEKLNRSIIHMTTLNYFLNVIVNERLYGNLLLCDARDMTLELVRSIISKVTGQKIWLIRLPRLFFLPIKLLSASVYDSLYRKQTIECSIPITNECACEIVGKVSLINLIKKLLV